MATQFNTPEDIRIFGQMVNGFSELGKSLAHGLGSLDCTKEEILLVVGEGHYNSLAASERSFVRYGKQIFQPLTGLFGAFVNVHLPEMALTRRLPTLAGENGFKLTATTSDGKVASWPLQSVAIDFIERQKGYDSGQPGRIVLKESLKSDVMIIEAGVALTSKESAMSWVSLANPCDINIVYTVDSDGNKFECSPSDGSYTFSMVDGQGKTVEPATALTILWGSLGARGMKLLESDWRRLTLQLDGTDDDFTAEGHLIRCVRAMKDEHGVDVMPYFNQLVEQQAKKLGGQDRVAPPYFLAAKKLFETAERIQWAVNSDHHKVVKTILFGSKGASYQTLRFATNASVFASQLEDTLAVFGLTMPPSLDSNPALKQVVQKVGKLVDERLITAEALSATIRRQELPKDIVKHLIVQSQYPFDSAWVSPEGGNTLKDRPSHIFANYFEALRYTVLNSGPEVVRHAKLEVRRILTEESLTRAKEGINAITETFNQMIIRLTPERKSAKDFYAPARDAASNIYWGLARNPTGFICPPEYLNAMERAVQFNNKIVGNMNNRNHRRAHKLRNEDKIIQLISTVRKVEGDFRKLIEKYGDTPCLERIGMFGPEQRPGTAPAKRPEEHAATTVQPSAPSAG